MKSMETPQVIATGLVTVDVILTCDSDWRLLDEQPGYAAGGTVCNILAYLGRFGWRAALLGGVGDEPLGRLVSADLRSLGVDTTLLAAREGLLTRRIAHLIVTHGHRKGAHKFLVSCPRCGIEFPAFPPLALRDVGADPSSYLTGETVLLIDRANELTADLARRVCAAGGTVVFEPGYVSRNRDAVVEVIRHTHILKYSEELRWGNQSFARAIPDEHPHLQLTIETRSKRGVKVMRANRKIVLTTTRLADVVDGAGAGDAFMAGFITGLGHDGVRHVQDLPDRVVESAVERGQAFGALACLFLGSKGLLYQRSVKEIEAAVSEALKTGRPPKTFGSERFVGTAVASALVGGSLKKGCPTCWIDQGP